ncbi:PhzF family phenazine biosynthesis protein [Sandaracinomonas limnophila]|uniref:PhzF family phenazine biosynthesis protein n=1 Tax=Sandaracinomonas limnophila TaxID=1862386 RepID=A0A437PP97_9BACT|nr:PhzF family phenazine biosynthesis protein [Sandaracinomonas limnophila]RVU24106.1 PhzF family phenazine biosynthesis protein [Sandaracinomonas limnophila]
MKLTLYQVDAFAEQVFQGNPAAVCPLAEWLPDEILQKIALENNLSETAFYVIQNNQVEIRWFTPNTEVELTKELIQSTNYMPKLAFKGKSDYLLIFENEEVISAIQPNLGNIEKLGTRGLIVSAKGNTCDFVSRFFGPNCGVNEDPVTGSAHTTLVPYWSNVYGKSDFIAKQLSERGGNLQCKLEGNRVEISGKAVLYLKGEIFI